MICVILIICKKNMIPFFSEKYPNYKKLFRQSLLSVSQQEHHGEQS